MKKFKSLFSLFLAVTMVLTMASAAALADDAAGWPDQGWGDPNWGGQGWSESGAENSEGFTEEPVPQEEIPVEQTAQEPVAEPAAEEAPAEPVSVPGCGIYVFGTDLVKSVYYHMGDSGLVPYEGIPGNDSDSFVCVNENGALVFHNFKEELRVEGDNTRLSAVYVDEKYEDENVYVVLEGENEITVKGFFAETGDDGSVNASSIGINATAEKILNFYGSGSLELVTDDMSTVSASFRQSAAIVAKKVFLNESAEVSAIAGNADYSAGIYTDKGVIAFYSKEAALTVGGYTYASSSAPELNMDGYQLSISSEANTWFTDPGVVTAFPEPIPPAAGEEEVIPEEEVSEEPAEVIIEEAPVEESIPEETYEAIPEEVTPEESFPEQTLTETVIPEIVKHPGDESGRKAGETVLFTTACKGIADAYWFINTPENPYIPADQIGNYLPGVSAWTEAVTVEGIPGSKITISNLTADCDGIQVYAVYFYGEDQFLVTNAATISMAEEVMEAAAVAPVTVDEPEVPAETEVAPVAVEEPEVPTETEVAPVTVKEPETSKESIPQTVTASAPEASAGENDALTGFFAEDIKAFTKVEEQKQAELSALQTQQEMTEEEITEEEEQPEAVTSIDASIMDMMLTTVLNSASSESTDGMEPGKAADFNLGLTPEENEGLTSETAPEGITFAASSASSGYLVGVQNGQKYRIGEDGQFVDIRFVRPDHKFEVKGLSGACIIQVINPGNGTTTKDSPVYNVEVGKFDTPTEDNVKAINADKNHPMEGYLYFDKAGSYVYRIKDFAGPFKGIGAQDPDSEIKIKRPAGVTYEVRIPCKENFLASDSIFVTILPYDAPKAIFKALDDRSGYLINLNDKMDYKIGEGDWIPVPTGTTSIYIPGVYKGTTISVRYRDTQAAADIVIDAQPTPDQSVIKASSSTNKDDSNGSITFTTQDYQNYEIRYGNFGTFFPVTSQKIGDLSSGIYYIRAKADGSKLASRPCKVIVMYEPSKGVDCLGIAIQPYEKIFDSRDGYSTLTVSFYPGNTTDQTVTFSSSNEGIVGFGSQNRTVVGKGGSATINIYPTGSGEATITATTANGKTAQCRVTVAFEYRFTYNKSGTWYYDRGGDYTVQTNGPVNRLQSVKINGNTLNPNYYSTRANTDGTTILTISQTAMRALNHGAYQRLQLVYNDGGTATTFLHILSVNDPPITGDDSNIVLWSILGLSSLAALAAVTVLQKKEAE